MNSIKKFKTIGMKTRVFFLVIFTVSSLFIQAQNEKDQKVKYSNITEWGFSGSPSASFLSLEGITVNGIAIGGSRIGLGLGLGLGGDFDTDFGVYCPIFLNYRYYFNHESSFSPHINVALGGTSRTDGIGIYSTLSSGFKSGKFSLSTGLFFQAYEKVTINSYYDNVTGVYITEDPLKNWVYPWGITIKVGFSF